MSFLTQAYNKNDFFQVAYIDQDHILQTPPSLSWRPMSTQKRIPSLIPSPFARKSLPVADAFPGESWRVADSDAISSSQ